jgi:hypothetical protein
LKSVVELRLRLADCVNAVTCTRVRVVDVVISCELEARPGP